MRLHLGRRRDTLVPKGVHAVFARSEAALVRSFPIRKTASGVWVPTPLPVIERALEILANLGLLDENRPDGRGLDASDTIARARPVVDAGAGDGRVAALLARFDPTRTVYAIERDAALFAQAHTNLDQLHTSGLLDIGRVRLLDADYADPRTYTDCGLDFLQVGLVFNYPDGNETRLAEFVATWASAATSLCLLTHNRALMLDGLELRAQADVEVASEESWQLSIYGTPSAGAS